jgi:serine/threonine protein kinase
MPDVTSSLPEWLGDYRISGPLGRGTVAEIFRGFARDGRAVAVKVLDAALRDDADAAADFEREAEALRSIHHPNVAALLDYGRTPDDRPYLVFELVDGPTLKEIIDRRERPDLIKGLDWMEEAAEGLQEAWFRRIIHRDIKPANLIIGPEGQMKIVDFGLSKAVFSGASPESSRGVFGTPRYMSPEMILGQSLDLRSDMYSLGATFFHYFTGESPFEATTPEEMMKLHAGSAPPPPHAIEPRLNDDICYVLTRLMAKDPVGRYESYDDLIDHLRKTRLALMSREGLVRQAPAKFDEPARGSSPGPYGGDFEQAAQMDRRQRAMAVSVEPPAHPVRRAILMFVGFVLVSGAAMLAFDEHTSPSSDRPLLNRSFDRLLRAVGLPEFRRADDQEEWEESDYRRNAANRQRMEDVMAMALAFRAERGRFPSSLDELVRAGLIRAADTEDAWGREFEFYAGTRTLYSYGADGIQSTPDDFRINAQMRWIAQPRARIGGG